MSSQYMLIEVIEREISEPAFFKNDEAAKANMIDLVCQTLDIDKTLDLDAKIEAVQNAGGDINLDAGTAYCERHGQNYDWKIFRI